MTNEAVIVELLGKEGDPIDFTIADGLAVEKGTLMKLIDPRACSGASTTAGGEEFAGIAAAEKVASDGQTNLALYQYGIFDLKNSSIAIGVGDKVSMSGVNLIKIATAAEVDAGQAIGKALEAGDADEVIEVLVTPCA